MQATQDAAVQKDGRKTWIDQPDLEWVAVPRDESFKVWSHGYPYRTVRWHFHPEYEIHLITSTTGKYFVGDHIGNFTPGNLVMVGPNLPHNWVSSVPQGERVDERCLVLQFDAAFIARTSEAFPEFRRVESLLEASRSGLLFPPETGAAAEPVMREMLHAQGLRRIVLFMALFELLARSAEPAKLASDAYRADPTRYAGTRINHVLAFIGKNLSQELRETELAALAGQSVSAFSRYFRRHTGVPFVQYVNRLRINLACQLLLSGELSITDICYQVGFNNLSNFNRQFLQLKQMSPSRWKAWQQLNAASAAAGAPASG
jgi:AraC-like DNA-binding protein